MDPTETIAPRPENLARARAGRRFPARRGRGFTLLELVVAVAIVAALAAIAIPLYGTYQRRVRFAELPLHVRAIFEGEISLKQSERTAGAGHVPGQYYAFASSIPTGCTPLGSTRHEWVRADYDEAARVDWQVEGPTYGCYTTSVEGGTPPSGVALAIQAQSDIDQDGRPSCVVLFSPHVGSGGEIAVAAPSGTCAGDPMEPWRKAQVISGNAI